MQIPCTLIIQKLGKRRSIIMANAVSAIHILVIMFAVNFEMLLISQLLCAFAYIIKGRKPTAVRRRSKGKIIEEGSHDYLISKGGAYSEFYSIQSLNK